MSVEKVIEEELKTIENDLNQIDRAIEKLSTKRSKLLSRKQILIRRKQENAAEELANQDWERCDHPWSSKVTNTLKTMFKMDKFRPYQLATINAVMSQQDCILLMPTGGGKSLCYQLPAMVLDGITLVVSPLVSLMEDQVMAMEALNLPAALLNANSTREHVNNVQKQMTEKNPSIKLLYVTPEKLAKSKRFMAKLEKMYKMGLFPLLAIDEVHCCSQWGHDFRTDYKFLGIMKRQFPKVPILGLTATATSSVIADVKNILNIQSSLVLKASFNRPNLKYEVVCKSSCQKDNITELESMLKNRFNGLSGIIYCFSVKDSEEIASELRKRGIKSKAYHAQLDAQSRSSVHKQWASNALQVIVATVAFGMGIDKPDVRFVIHHSMPKSMENFYQESGRAGRDDHSASCILFYRFPDIFRQSTMVFTEQKGLEHLYAMVAYCLDLSRCRRAIIAEHFGERWNSTDCNSMCDHCDNFSPYVEKTKNIAKECRTIVQILDHCNMIEERLTNQKLIEAWIGKGPPKLRPPDHKATLLAKETCERIIGLLLLESYLIEEFHFTPYSTISYINVGSRRLPPDQDLMLPMPSLRGKTSTNESSVPCTSSSSSTTPSSVPVKTSASKESSNSGNIKKRQNETVVSKKPSSSSNSSKEKSSHSSTNKSDFKQSPEKSQKHTASKKNSLVSSKRSSMPEKKYSKKLKAMEEVVLLDDEMLEKSRKTTASTDDNHSRDSLEFDDYDLESHSKKQNYKRIATVTLSDSD